MIHYEEGKNTNISKRYEQAIYKLKKMSNSQDKIFNFTRNQQNTK